MAKRFENGIDLRNQRGVNAASPSSGTDLVNKDYVDNKIHGLSYKEEVRVATTAAGTLATDFDDGSTVDGVTIATDERILLKNQADPAENGVYIVAASGAPVRAADADSTGELNNATVMVTEGTVNEGREYTQTTVDPVVDTDDLVWAQTGAGATYTADGEGIEVSSNEFSLELDGSTLQKSSSGLRIGSGAAGAGLTEASGVLAVGAGTGITVNADDVEVDTSIVARKFSASIGNGSSTAIAVNHQLGTKDVSVTIRDNSNDEHVEADVVSTDTNNVTITFATAPTSSQYRATVIG